MAPGIGIDNRATGDRLVVKANYEMVMPRHEHRFGQFDLSPTRLPGGQCVSVQQLDDAGHF